MSFVGLVALLPAAWLVPVSVTWGVALLAALTALVARARSANPWTESPSTWPSRLS
jgi:hypothetical protein